MRSSKKSGVVESMEIVDEIFEIGTVGGVRHVCKVLE